MRKRYTNHHQLSNITPRYNDSVIWRNVFRFKELTDTCMQCGPDVAFDWKGRGSSFTMNNVWETIRPRRAKDPTTVRIWSSALPKTGNFLWRLNHKHIPTSDRIISKGGNSNTICPLCNIENELNNHLFFKCTFSSWVINEGFKASVEIVKPQSILVL